ncbi:MAG: prepilin-type N-terminal cleavage/methylation domain-containing protein, partial [Deltaproteobacteria bacterium]
MSRDGRNRGFTLVELMVAVVISFIVVGWIYSTYIVHQRVFSTETQITDLQYEGSTAISVLAKDLRESGFGVPENPNINGVTSSLIISDSGTDGGPDTLTLLGGYRVIATLAQDINPGMTSFKVTWQGGISANTSDRSH